jgi:hypothetical protein
MVKRALATLFCFLLLCNIASAEETQKLKIIGANPDTKPVSFIDPLKPTIGLQQAKNNTLEYGKNNSLPYNSLPENVIPETTEQQKVETKEEKVASENVISGMVTEGINNFGKNLIDGMYASFDNNTEINQKFGSTRGAIFTVITYVPNPYGDPTIKELYTNYNNLAIFFVVIFIFGEWANRNLARTKATSSVFDDKDLSTSKFWGGLCMCGIALCANFFYIFALQIIQALSQFTMSNVMGSIAPSPDNLILYFMMALCDLTVFIFFVIRYFIIYAVAVLCSIIAVLLVPDFSRDFAKKSIDYIARILLLQPVTIFFTSLGILTLKGMPAALQPFGYVGLTVFVFLICWYMLFGDFEFIKKGVKIAASKGLV